MPRAESRSVFAEERFCRDAWGTWAEGVHSGGYAARSRLISYRYGRLTILSPDGLAEGACECYQIMEAQFASSTSPGAETFGSPALSINNVLNRLDRTGFSFLLQDTEIALTLTRIAHDAKSDPEKRARNLTNARRAYETVTGLMGRVALTPEEGQELTGKLRQLKTELQLLGEEF